MTTMTSLLRHVWSDITLILVMTWLTLQTFEQMIRTEAKIYYIGDAKRFKGEEFGGEFEVAGRNVTCSGGKNITKTALHPAELWSCHDIRVAGRRLQYWHMDGLCSDGTDSSKMAANDYGALCRHIMELHGIKRTLWAAIIREASCKLSYEPRVMYIKDVNASFMWQDYRPGRGHVITLQCMSDNPQYKQR